MAPGVNSTEVTLGLLQRLSSAPEEGPFEPVTREEALSLNRGTPNDELWSAANERGIALQKVAAALHGIMSDRSNSHNSLIAATCYLKLLGVGQGPPRPLFPPLQNL